MGDRAPEVEISGLAYTSTSVTPGALFFCVPGFTKDGHDFAPDAVERGAVALVCQRPLGLGVPELVVDDVREAMGPAAARFYDDPTAQQPPFRPMRDGGDRAGPMGVLSRPRGQGRTTDIRFACRVFTNRNQEH